MTQALIDFIRKTIFCYWENNILQILFPEIQARSRTNESYEEDASTEPGKWFPSLDMQETLHQ